jgi:hypothetical protein
MRFTEKTMDSITIRDKTSKILDKMEYDQNYNGVKSITERKINRLEHKIEYFGTKLENLILEFNKIEDKLKKELSQELFFYEHILKWKQPKVPSVTGDSIINEYEEDLNSFKTHESTIDPRELLILLPKKYKKKILQSEPYCHTSKYLSDLEEKIVSLERDMRKYRQEYYKLIDSLRIEKIDSLRDSEINLKFRRRQSNLWQCLHPILVKFQLKNFIKFILRKILIFPKDFELNIEEVENALKLVNKNLINDREFQYIIFILDLPGYHRINFKLFCLIASLSEKVSQLE